MAVVLTLAQTKQIRINYIKETIQIQSTNNKKTIKYKYTYYQNTHTYTVVTRPVSSSLKNGIAMSNFGCVFGCVQGRGLERALSALN